MIHTAVQLYALLEGVFTRQYFLGVHFRELVKASWACIPLKQRRQKSDRTVGFALDVGLVFLSCFLSSGCAPCVATYSSYLFARQMQYSVSELSFYNPVTLLLAT